MALKRNMVGTSPEEASRALYLGPAAVLPMKEARTTT